MHSDAPLALLLKYPGTNCDFETARALQLAGFQTRIVPISQAVAEDFSKAKLAVFSGGFSYGDYVMAGRIAQLVTQQKLGHLLETFVSSGGYVLGICNGFQIITKLGLLPEGSLIDNSSGRFICRWVKMNILTPDNAFLRDLPDSGVIELPMAHAEGRFVAPEGRAQEYVERGLATLTYTEDVNGSTAGIAGLQDETGRVFGLMPHPERFIFKNQHYDADWNGDRYHGWGYYFFKSIWREVTGGRKLIATMAAAAAS